MHPATQHATPAAAYLLADNLDTALAAGEDLLKSSVTLHPAGALAADAIADMRAEERQEIQRIRTLEAILMARVLKSRERAAELAKREAHMRPLAKLYNAAASLLVEAVGELGGDAGHDFHAGGDLTAYLRSRGLIAADAAAPPESGVLAVTEEFLIGGCVALGAMLDLASMMLDTLEAQFDIYDEGERSALGILAARMMRNEAVV